MARRKVLDTHDFKVGQDKPRDMPSTGPARIDPIEVEPVEGPANKAFLDELAFLEEEITIKVMDTTDKTAIPIPEVGVNGRRQFFIRNRVQTVKRKFVEALSRAKITSYTQEEYLDDAGNRSIRNVPHTTLAFPFQVVEDKSPNASAWLRKILAEAA